jgi:nucleotide-binding universal stress UspA family protein
MLGFSPFLSANLPSRVYSMVRALNGNIMIDKILVAIATPESNSYIFDQALMLAKATGAHLGLIHVADPDETAEEMPTYLAGLKPYMSGEDESEPFCYLGDFETVEPDLFGAYVSKAKTAGVSIDCIYCFGDPEAAINDFALAWEPSLLVLGRRRRSGIAEFFLGSVSNYTLHHAQCSIYVVQEPIAL